MLLWTATFLLAIAVIQTSAEQITPDYAENIDNKDAWNARIVSGWRAHPGQFPHMVSLRMVGRNGRVQACGASVISRQWILTAAHCTATQITLVVRAGVTNLTRPEFITETQEYYMYSTFNPATPTAVQPDDIAVVKLPNALSYSEFLKPIRLQSSADAHRDYDSLITIASGFGRTWTSGPQTEHLLWVNLRGISNAACAGVFSNRFVTDNTICARFFNVTSQSICQGDSGGPLVHVSSEGELILIGVSSFVAAEPHGCHSGLPSAFIRPGPFHSWFTRITGIDFENIKEDDTTSSSTSTSTSTTTSTPVPITTTSTLAPSTITSQRPTSSSTITTVTLPPTSVPTLPPSTITTQRPTSSSTFTTVTLPPTSVPTLSPSTITTQRPTSTSIFTTVTSPPTAVTTLAPTTPQPEEEDIDDPELEEILKRLEIKVKVKVRLSKYLKKKKKQIKEVQQ